MGLLLALWSAITPAVAAAALSVAASPIVAARRLRGFACGLWRVDPIAAVIVFVNFGAIIGQVGGLHPDMHVALPNP